MLDFITELDKLLERWPQTARWTISQVAEMTKSDIPLVIECFSSILGRDLDAYEPLGIEEAGRTLLILKEKMHGEFEARILEQKAQQQEACRKYALVAERVRTLEIARNWRAASRTLSYFAGSHFDHLPREQKLTLVNDLLRFGVKAGLNLQEMGQWLRKGVECCMNSPSLESFEDAIDFLDAYGDYFKSRGGDRTLGQVIAMLRPGIAQHELEDKLGAVVSSLKLDPTAGMDGLAASMT